MQYKTYQPHNSDSVFTNSLKYIFKVHQITTLGGNLKIQHFSGNGMDKNTVQDSQNMPLQMKNSFFLGRGLVPSPCHSPGAGGEG